MKIGHMITIIAIAVGTALCAAAVTGCGAAKQKDAQKTAELSYYIKHR